ncbi:MAG TPA: 4Fe-4S dicluster domain-containing protein, partial [Thermoanaerobaculia bacterium]|nr:4Fe-4S dicluster domain-containing protein [Thermoanaerobaculia bacterium]
NQPQLDDYYEPWTYRYADLFDAPPGDEQPAARPVSPITGDDINISAGPNWDDDLSGSSVYASNDPNLAALTPAERAAMFSIERLTFMYLPRICNHCINPSCVASCPSGAMYKRGEDGVVLVNQDQCRGWRACVVGCPYKKTYYNWKTGKAEKCILCYPRIETGQAPACFHSCVGRIRYMGVLLYDARRIESAGSVPAEALVEAQRSMLLDPFDPVVVAEAEANGVSPEMIAAAQASPVWKFVREWELALPLHPEYRTLPMLFYVPPLLPAMGRLVEGVYSKQGSDALFAAIDDARAPLSYLATLFSAGNVDVVRSVMRRLMAVRWYRRSLEVNDVDPAVVQRMLRETKLTPEQADAIYKLTALANLDDRYVMAPIQREEAFTGDTPNPAE